MTRGRPLRFLALTLGGWIAARIVILWPATTPPSVVAGPAVPRAIHQSLAKSHPPLMLLARQESRVSARGVAVPTKTTLPARAAPIRRDEGRNEEIAPASVALETAAPSSAQQPESSRIIPFAPLPTQANPPSASRLAGDIWLVARANGGQTLAFGQLGAAQAGMRLTYAVDDARRIALSARASTPLQGAGREAAFGVDWRPTALPVHLLIEERVPLDGGAARPAAQLIGGGTWRLPLHLQLEGYAQAGAVHRRGAFADGAARVARPVLEVSGMRVDLGVGAWGAAQRGAVRVDVGPTLGVAVPARGGSVRLGLDYGIM